MSRIIGTVTRSIPDTIVESQQSSQGNRACFSASAGTLSLGGDFRNAREAQVAVEAALGGAKARWTRQDLPGRVEHYVGRTGRDDPLEIYGFDNLLLWSEMDGTVSFVGGVAPTVARVGDRSGHRNSLVSVAGFEPALIGGPGGLPALDFSGDRMTSAAAVDPLMPLTISTVAFSVVPPAVNRNLWQAGVAPTPLILRVDAASVWTVLSSGAPIAGAATGVGVPAVVQVRYTPGGAGLIELWIDNALVASGPGSFTAGAFLLSTLVDPWFGYVSAVVVALSNDLNERSLTYQYLRARFDTP